MTDGPTDDEVLEEFIARKRAQKKGLSTAGTPDSPPVREWDSSLIPDAQYVQTREDQEIDQILGRVGIVEAYQRWCNKSKVHVRPGQTESIMISCPKPDHLDKEPSAWLNTQKEVYHCGTCSEGGDKFDIAAYHFGYPVPGYKPQLPKLKRDMAKSMGYVVTQSANPALPDSIHLPTALAAPVPPPVEPLATVTQIKPILDVPNEKEMAPQVDLTDILFPTLDWRQVVAPNTFLDEYMNCCIIDDAAEEYHFWNGMLAIGLAVGKKITLSDLIPVYGNLLLCTLGRTGERKSRSMAHLVNVLQAAMPYDFKSGISTGVKIVRSAASGEALIDQFNQTLVDPTNPKVTLQGTPVRGLAIYSELAGLVGRAQRQGSVIKDTIMQFADCDSEVSTTSVTRGTSRALEPFLSAATTTQPESLKDLLKDGDNTSGFLNRWIFASGKPKTKVAIGGAKVDITPAVLPLVGIHNQLGREIRWTDEAYDLFTTHFHNAIEPAQKVGPILGRLDLLEKKLILLLSINENHLYVQPETVRKVMAMHIYLTDAYGLTSEHLRPITENNKIHEDIRDQIKRMTPLDSWGPTARNIKDRLARKGYDKIRFERILELVAKEDDIEVTQGDPTKPGRKTDHYKWVG